ncbi:MAG TPA: NADP(H)-dependent aldo-keto reductase [Alphaproteobacteria bacterium]|nr:NADP(H)-dependent aldo-keto reductase [Alphaproteobacteria bacterium]
MQFSKLGNTDISVSKICLGTMTWGEQNSEAEAHLQMDMAVSKGINFFDTAEMYPVPPRAETQGKTEEYIGSWLKKTGKRKDIILASKVIGKSDNFDYIRPGFKPILDRKNIEYALNNSLRRLETDYIDLYQIHWPERTANFFGQLGYIHNKNETPTALSETLDILTGFVKQGKIRYIGLSNETPWGVMDAIRSSEKYSQPKIVSIQNPYSLLNRSYEIGLAEISIRENCGLLAYSPLAFGMLTGKYLNGAKPPEGRITKFGRFQRYNNVRSHQATAEYCAIAKKYSLSPAQMSLAYINSRPFVTSNIIGATNLNQLEENINSIDIKLTAEIINEIEVIHHNNPNPAP